MKLGVNSPRCAACGQLVENDLGDHALICAFGKGRIYRHDLLRNWIEKHLSVACCDFIVEKKILLDDQKRPAVWWGKCCSGYRNYIGNSHLYFGEILQRKVGGSDSICSEESWFYLNKCRKRDFRLFLWLSKRPEDGQRNLAVF